MARTKRCVKVLDTIWECPDDLWDNVMFPIIEFLDSPKHTCRKRVDLRQALISHHPADGNLHPSKTSSDWRLAMKASTFTLSLRAI